MAHSLTQAADDLTALAWRMHQLAEAELNALRMQLQQERQARQEAVERVETLEMELAQLKERNEREWEPLREELERERQGRARAEEEVTAIHTAILEQIALGEAEEAALKATEQERDRQRQEQTQALHNQLELERLRRVQMEGKLRGVRQAFYDLLLPTDPEEPIEETGTLERLLQLETRL